MRKPDGTYALTEREYLDAWLDVIFLVEKALNMTCKAYDPGVLLENSEKTRTYDISADMAVRIATLYKQSKEGNHVS